MIIKLQKVISCSSEHPKYPATNLLEFHSNRSWRCAKPGEMLATVIFQVAEPSAITGLDIGNYRSCVVIVEASTISEPDKWVPIANHQFLTNDEATNNKFRDQVQIFTKKELNPDTFKTKFDRIKVTCMQSANPRELFGLTFITFKTEVVVDLGLDVFGRFKMKEPEENKKTDFDDFREKYKKLMGKDKPTNSSFKEELKNKAKEASVESFSKRQNETRDPPKRPLLQMLEDGKEEEVFGKKESTPQKEADTKKTKTEKKVEYTPFGDVVTPKASKKDPKKNGEASTSSQESKKKPSLDQDEEELTKKDPKKNGEASTSGQENKKKHSLDQDEEKPTKKMKCSECESCEDKLCKDCGQLYAEKEKQKRQEEKKKQKKPFNKLFEGITFSLSGYVNPQRDSLRKKALQMGAKYIADPNTNNPCTHLICAFRNTPKYQQLKNCSKIVSHVFIEDCFDNKMRWVGKMKSC